MYLHFFFSFPLNHGIGKRMYAEIKVTGLWQDPPLILRNTQQSDTVSFLEGLLEGHRKDPLGGERFMRTKGKMEPRKKL